MNPFDPNCEACRKRREAVAAWLEACRQWARNPIGKPMPAPPTDGLTPVGKFENIEKSAD